MSEKHTLSLKNISGRRKVKTGFFSEENKLLFGIEKDRIKTETKMVRRQQNI